MKRLVVIYLTQTYYALIFVESIQFLFQNVNSYLSRLKKWMDRFNSVATKGFLLILVKLTGSLTQQSLFNRVKWLVSVNA